MIRCEICGEEKNLNYFKARELMIGFRDEFKYFECKNCGCIQILEIPQNLQKYYNTDYYSFEIPKSNSIRNYLKKKRALFYLDNKSIVGYLLSKIFNSPQLINWVKVSGISFNSSILDIGSGSGKLLMDFYNIGFNNLLGIDPFIKNEIIYNENLLIKKKSVFEVDGKFDFIMMHHSLEHMQNHFEIMKKIKSLMHVNSILLIRIPIASEAWQKYGENWVSLDAPRHFVVHSQKSFEMLSKESGFNIFYFNYDSIGYQFWASEQYKLNIPYKSRNSYRMNPDKSIFNKNQIAEFETMAQNLNEINRGDQACFYLKMI